MMFVTEISVVFLFNLLLLGFPMMMNITPEDTSIVRINSTLILPV
jgi:hypothetical protein